MLKIRHLHWNWKMTILAGMTLLFFAVEGYLLTTPVFDQITTGSSVGFNLNSSQQARILAGSNVPAALTASYYFESAVPKGQEAANDFSLEVDTQVLHGTIHPLPTGVPGSFYQLQTPAKSLLRNNSGKVLAVNLVAPEGQTLTVEVTYFDGTEVLIKASLGIIVLILWILVLCLGDMFSPSNSRQTRTFPFDA